MTTEPIIAAAIAGSMTTPALVDRLRLLVADPSGFDRNQRNAYILEAARRLDKDAP